MTSHKNQHFIPRCYLKAWCDPLTPSKQSPYVWQFTKDGSRVKRKSPENIFSEKDMYTIKDSKGNRNLILETGLSQLETKFSSLRDKKIKQKTQISTDEHFLLCAFVSAMFARTKKRREHHSETWNKVLEQQEELREKVAKMTPKEIQNLPSYPKPINKPPSFTYKEVKEMAEQPLQSWLRVEINGMTPLLASMALMIFETSDVNGFITSDSPCVVFDYEAYKRPLFYQSPSLLYDSTELTLPISPNQMLVFNNKGYWGYAKIADKVLDDYNRRTRFFAHESFIVNANIKKEIWFDSGIEPEDSWNKTHSEMESDE